MSDCNANPDSGGLSSPGTNQPSDCPSHPTPRIVESNHDIGINNDIGSTSGIIDLTSNHSIPIEDIPPPKEVSIVIGFVNLANVAIGVGTLSLPRAFANVGWLGGVILLSLSCLTSSWSLYLLTVAAHATQAQGYTDLAAIVLGRKSWMVTWTFFILVIGSLSAYFSVISDNLAHILDVLVPVFVPSTYVLTSELRNWIHQLFLIIITMLCIYPLSTARTMSSLAWVSSMSLISILFVVILVSLSYVYDVTRPNWKPPQSINALVFGWQWLPTMSTMAIAFLNHSNVIEIFRELNPVSTTPTSTSTSSNSVHHHNRDLISGETASTTSYNDKNNRLLITLTSLFVFVVYLICAISGYLHYGNQVAGNILSSEGNSPIFFVARLSIFSCIVLSFPLLVYPCRLCISQMIFEFQNWRQEIRDIDNNHYQPIASNIKCSHSSPTISTSSSSILQVSHTIATTSTMHANLKSTSVMSNQPLVVDTLLPSSSLLSKSSNGKNTDSYSYKLNWPTMRPSSSNMGTVNAYTRSLSPRSQFVHQSSTSPIGSEVNSEISGTNSPLLTATDETINVNKKSTNPTIHLSPYGSPIMIPSRPRSRTVSTLGYGSTCDSHKEMPSLGHTRSPSDLFPIPSVSVPSPKPNNVEGDNITTASSVVSTTTPILTLFTPIESWVATKALSIMLLSWTLSMIVPSLDRILGITGSLAGSLVVYVFPAIFYLLLAAKKSVPRSQILPRMAWCNITLGVILFIIGSICSVIQ